MENINKLCLEQILKRLTKLITLLEFEDIETTINLVNLSISVSSQLLEIQKYEEMEIEEMIEVCEEQEGYKNGGYY